MSKSLSRRRFGYRDMGPGGRVAYRNEALVALGPGRKTTHADEQAITARRPTAHPGTFVSSVPSERTFRGRTDDAGACMDPEQGEGRRRPGQQVVPVPAPRERTTARPTLAIIGRSRVFVEAVGSGLTRTGAATVVLSAIDLPTGIGHLTALLEAPSVVLLHAAVPDGTRAVADVRAVLPHSGVVVMGLGEGFGDPVGWAQAGALGLLDLAAGMRDLISTIRAVSEGQAMCSPSITAALLDRLSQPRPRPEPWERGNLTPREVEVEALLADGLSNKEIARRLCIEVATVKNHVHNVLTKLDMSSRAQTRN